MCLRRLKFEPWRNPSRAARAFLSRTFSPLHAHTHKPCTKFAAVAALLAISHVYKCCVFARVGPSPSPPPLKIPRKEHGRTQSPSSTSYRDSSPCKCRVPVSPGLRLAASTQLVESDFTVVSCVCNNPLGPSTRLAPLLQPTRLCPVRSLPADRASRALNQCKIRVRMCVCLYTSFACIRHEEDAPSVQEKSKPSFES